MEGNTEQYHIRTMARDLERARGKLSPQTPPLPPKKAEVQLPKRVSDEERKLSDILAEARVRVAQAPARKTEAPIRVAEAPIRKTLDDILPIEPLETTRLDSARQAMPIGRQAPFREKMPRPEPRVVQGPPLNLPTGEPSFIPKPPPAAIARERAETEEKIKRTPEEILGLPVKRSPTTPSARRGEPAKPVPVRQGKFRFILLTGFLATVIIGLVYGIYWKISKPEAPPVPPPALKISEQPPPKALIQTIETETIELSGLGYDDLRPKIDALAETKFLPESLAYIPIKFSTGKETRYLTLLEIFEVLQIDAPPILYDHKNFTLYLYSQGIEARKLCDEAGIVSLSCYGPRIGIVIQFPALDEGALTKDIAFSVMKEWEKTIIDDLGPLMLALPTKTGPASPSGLRGASAQFARGKYKNFDVSFVNLPISTTSLDWILTDTHLIIATSKDAARAAVDALK